MTEAKQLGGILMKAIVNTHYGSPDVLQLKEVEKPAPSDHEVLVKVLAASAAAGDWHLLRAQPFLMRFTSGLLKPKHQILGAAFAGRVETVGRNVTQFQPGDEVFGDVSACGFGAFAEYVSVPEKAVALKPTRVTFEEAATVPVSAVTALQGLCDQGHIQPGQKVLINGASGGVGTFAVQIAKAFGAEVTGVCSTRNVDMVRSIGADYVIDYMQEDFTKNGQRYDLIERISSDFSVSARLKSRGHVCHDRRFHGANVPSHAARTLAIKERQSENGKLAGETKPERSGVCERAS